VNIVLLKNFWKDTNMKRHLSMLVTWERGKQILIWTYPNDDLWNLKFST
jgi:hypothetical protein